VRETGGKKARKEAEPKWCFQALLLYGDDLLGPPLESVTSAFGEAAVTRYMTARGDLDEKADRLKLFAESIPRREQKRENTAGEVARLRGEFEKLKDLLNAAEQDLAESEEDLRNHRANYERLRGEVEGGRLDFLRRNLQASGGSDESGGGSGGGSGGKRSRTDGRGTDDEIRKKRKVEGKKGRGEKHKKATPPESRAGSTTASPARTTTPLPGNVSMHMYRF
jgi:hypothetical protein